MFIVWVVIVPAENCEGICNIGPSGGHRVQESSDHRLVYGQMPGLFVGLPVVQLHCHWHGNWSGLIHSEHRQDCPYVAVLIDVDRVMLPIAFDITAEIEGDNPEIMHLESLPHLILDVPNQALVTNEKEIINLQNDHSNNYVLILILTHKESSVDM
jgi:hypothetical protein